eukprot:NODE_100_length_20331_cov_1.214462.p19 type:complete len:133 gc:universal NODE_100_length_20331_cov_1.214462:8776-8378(-)
MIILMLKLRYHFLIKKGKFDNLELLNKLTDWIYMDLKYHLETKAISIADLMMELSWTLESCKQLLNQLRYISRFYPVDVMPFTEHIQLVIRNDKMENEIYTLSHLRESNIKVKYDEVESRWHLGDLKSLFVK